MLDKLRKYNEKIFLPVIRLFVRLKISPNALTLISLFGGTISFFYIVNGNLLLGGLIFLFFSFLDSLDGMLARYTRKETAFGAFLDSTVDRYSESMIYLSIILYALKFSENYKILIILTFISFVGSILTSYVKARGENFVPNIKSGFFQRPERVVVLGLGFIFNELYIALIILSIVTNFTVLQRIIYIYNKIK